MSSQSNRSRSRSRKPQDNRGRSNKSNGRGNGGRGKRKGAPEVDPALFVNDGTADAPTVNYVAEHAFSDFELGDKLQANIVRRGYREPTQIQDQCITPVLDGRDVIGLANTGTGKTAAFALPIAELLHADEAVRAALVLVPTRELASQVDDEFRAFTTGMGLKSAVCVGGASINKQIAALRRRPQMIIGTPGRLKDLFDRREIDPTTFDVLVLDEADRMLDMGFIRDIRWLVDKLPSHRQTLCFSATMTRAVEQLMDDFLDDPLTVSVRTSTTSDHIEQRVVEASDKQHKAKLLEKMLREPEFEKVIVFTQTKHGAQRLALRLTKSGLPAEAIHGNRNQNQRQRSLDAFKRDKANILVATDVASRGLDIPDVSHVINFDEPASYEDYVHRIGRTGRAGKGGNAVTFVVPSLASK